LGQSTTMTWCGPGGMNAIDLSAAGWAADVMVDIAHPGAAVAAVPPSGPHGLIAQPEHGHGQCHTHAMEPRKCKTTQCFQESSEWLRNC
jgi:hypothetical protein